MQTNDIYDNAQTISESVLASLDLVVKNGTIVTQSYFFEGAIAIKDEIIVAITSNENAPTAANVVDATGLHVLPGVIDVHVHFRDPGYTSKEDFGSGSAAAAAGGVTLIFDMPNNYPPPKDVQALNLKIEEAKKKSIVDYGLYGLLTVGNLAEVSPLAKAGVVGYKCFMGETVGKIPAPSDGEMLDQFAVVSNENLRVSVHAENDPILQYKIKKLRSEGRGDAHAHYESRPQVVEEEAVRRAILYAAESKCKLHIAHLSSGRGVAAVAEAKRRHQPVTAETCPQYLVLDDEYYSKVGSLMKVNPSIKTSSDRSSLWEAINNGTVDMIATDHSPHALEEKKRPVIFDCVSGFPGLETSVPLMLTQVNKGMIALTKYVELTSANPAKAWRLYPKKGAIRVGSDADLTIVDLKARSRVDPSKFYSKAKWSPFDGLEVQGLPVYTVVRGNVVMDHGVVEKKPLGRMVTPLASAN
jgi:dihydroorotase